MCIRDSNTAEEAQACYLSAKYGLNQIASARQAEALAVQAITYDASRNMEIDVSRKQLGADNDSGDSDGSDDDSLYFKTDDESDGLALIETQEERSRRCGEDRNLRALVRCNAKEYAPGGEGYYRARDNFEKCVRIQQPTQQQSVMQQQSDDVTSVTTYLPQPLTRASNDLHKVTNDPIATNLASWE